MMSLSAKIPSPLSPRKVLSVLSPFSSKYEFISFHAFSEVSGGPARYVHFLEPAITHSDLLRSLLNSLSTHIPKKGNEGR
jgi:hypothetical protein